jgi:hypothetical protein
VAGEQIVDGVTVGGVRRGRNDLVDELRIRIDRDVRWLVRRR